MNVAFATLCWTSFIRDDRRLDVKMVSGERLQKCRVNKNERLKTRVEKVVLREKM
jgi:hypothetical protein